MERVPKSNVLPNSDTLVFAWKVTNYSDMLGGPINSLVIGKDNHIIEKNHDNDFQNAVILGIILIMFIYHLLEDVTDY